MPLSKKVMRERKKNERVVKPKVRVVSNLKGVAESEYPDSMKPLLVALGDIKQRKKLRLICEALSRRQLLEHVWYGRNVRMDEVAELLEAW